MHRTICMAALLALALFLPVGASAQTNCNQMTKQPGCPSVLQDYPAPTQGLGPNDVLVLQQSTGLGRTQPYSGLTLGALAAYLGTGGTCKPLLNMSGQPILNMSNQQILVGC